MKIQNCNINEDEHEFHILKLRGRPKNSNNGALNKIFVRKKDNYATKADAGFKG